MRMKRLLGAMAPARLAALAAALAVAGLGVPAAQAEAVKLKAASFLPERVIFAKHFYEWAARVNEECAGEVEISVVGPAAVPSLEQWRALKTGVIDMHFGPPNYYKGEAIEADVSILAKNGAAEQKENGAWAMLNQLHNEKLNAWYLTHIHDGVNFFLYTSKPHQDGRFDGMRIRSVPIYDGFFRYLGADPVRMAPPDVGTALERGGGGRLRLAALGGGRLRLAQVHQVPARSRLLQRQHQPPRQPGPLERARRLAAHLPQPDDGLG